MVETACENNDEHIDSDSDTIEIIVEKGMVVAVLADFFIVGVAQNCKRIVLQEGTKLRSKTFLLKLIPGKTAACYSAAICFICAELEKDKITVLEELHHDILQSLDTCI